MKSQLKGQSIGFCKYCTKQRYKTRKDAKTASRRNHPNKHMSVYECGGFWHYGKLPTTIARGYAERDSMQQYPPTATTRKKPDHT